ncbi:MAG: hypothetical protein KF861_24230 [Planctomycetaceae bacterium]|nr:hypothetical protein [Planctomycetaceae bacterium]
MRSPAWNMITAAIVPLALFAALGLSGCQVGRTFFQMDSNAPVPFFGMDLLPQREKSSPTKGVSRFQNEMISSPVETRPDSSASAKTSRSWGTLLGRSSPDETLTLPASVGNASETAIVDAPAELFR